MVSQLEPKPTIYKGQQFASRLEARWAVFLDHQSPLVWDYEPITFKDTSTGWTYTPDFAVATSDGRKILGFLEIKPVIPAEDYLKDIHRFLPMIEHSSELILCWGSFYKETPKLVNLHLPNLAYNSIAVTSIALDQCSLFPKIKEGIKAAASYRFDLPDKKRKRRKKK